MSSAFIEQDYSKEFSLSTWKEIFRFARPHRKNMIFMVFLMVSIAAIDSVNPFFTRWIIDHVIIPGRTSGLLPFSLVYLGVITIQSLIIWQFISQAGRVEMGVCYEIRRAAFRRLQELSYSYFDRTPVGWIMARLTSDTQKLGEVMAWGMIDMTWGTTMMAGLAVLMIIVNWKLALITLSVVPALAIMAVLFQRRILARYRQVRKINSRITASFNEGIMGARTTKTLVRERENLRDFRVVTGEMRDQSIRAALLSAVFLPAVLTFGTIGTALALWSGGSAVIAGTLTYGTLVAFLFASIQFFDPIMELSRVIADIQYAQASAERVVSLVKTEPAIRNCSGASSPTESWPAREASGMKPRVLGRPPPLCPPCASTSAAGPQSAATSPFDTSPSPTRAARRCSTISISRFGPASGLHWSVRQGRARARSSILPAASTSPRADRSRSTR